MHENQLIQVLRIGNHIEDIVCMTTKKHIHILLSENSSGTVSYCEECRVAELEFGAISLRLDEQSLATLSTLLKDAKFRLNAYLDAKQKPAPKQADSLVLH